MRIPLIMALALIILSVAVDLYIFFDIKRNSRRSTGTVAYGISSVICWIFMLICLLLPRRDAAQGISFQMWGLYSYLSIYVPKIIFVIFSLIGGIPGIWKGHTLQTGKWIGIPIGIILFCMMWYGALVTRKQIEVTEVTITSSKLPEGFEGYSIIQISDLHLGTWGEDTKFVERLTDTVNSLKPDLILFTGDIVNRDTREMQPFLKILSTMRAKDGIYSVLGNHDYGDYVEWPSAEEKAENLQLLKNWQRQIGWRLLNNESVNITSGNDTIRLIGVENWGEPPFRQYGHLTDAYPLTSDSIRNLKDSNFKILMTHNPEHWLREVTKISNIDLSLSGHTHAMQFEIKAGKWKWSPSKWRYPAWGGLYERSYSDGEPMYLYVNVGAGEVGMPFRIGAVPEITVITLHSGNNSNTTPAQGI